MRRQLPNRALAVLAVCVLVCGCVQLLPPALLNVEGESCPAFDRLNGRLILAHDASGQMPHAVRVVDLPSAEVVRADEHSTVFVEAEYDVSGVGKDDGYIVYIVQPDRTCTRVLDHDALLGKSFMGTSALGPILTDEIRQPRFQVLDSCTGQWETVDCPDGMQFYWEDAPVCVGDDHFSLPGVVSGSRLPGGDMGMFASSEGVLRVVFGENRLLARWTSRGKESWQVDIDLAFENAADLAFAASDAGMIVARRAPQADLRVFSKDGQQVRRVALNEDETFDGLASDSHGWSAGVAHRSKGCEIRSGGFEN